MINLTALTEIFDLLLDKCPDGSDITIDGHGAGYVDVGTVLYFESTDEALSKLKAWLDGSLWEGPR